MTHLVVLGLDSREDELVKALQSGHRAGLDGAPRW